MPQQFAQNEPSVKDAVRGTRTIDVLPSDVARKKAKGLAYQIDDNWRRDITKLMKDKGMTQADLRREIGCSKGNLSDALSLRVGKPSSRWVPAIHAVLGLEPPSPTTVAVAKTDPAGPAATQSTRDLIKRLVDVMTEEQAAAWLADMLNRRGKE